MTKAKITRLRGMYFREIGYDKPWREVRSGMKHMAMSQYTPEDGTEGDASWIFKIEWDCEALPTMLRKQKEPILIEGDFVDVRFQFEEMHKPDTIYEMAQRCFIKTLETQEEGVCYIGLTGSGDPQIIKN